MLAPSEEQKEAPIQLLQINKVDPIMGGSTRVEECTEQKILDYYKVNEVDTFEYSRPFQKGKDKSNEFAGLWLERTILRTKHQFPSILSQSEIRDEQRFEVSPLDVAIENMERTNKDVKRLILEHTGHRNPPLNPLSMKLNGIIDAAVMGGTNNYERAFFTPEYIAENPDDEDKVTALKDLMADQIPLLEAGMQVHEAKMTEDLRPLHQRLSTMFGEMRRQVEEKYGKRDGDVLVSIEPKMTDFGSSPGVHVQQPQFRKSGMGLSAEESSRVSLGSNASNADATTRSKVLHAIGITRKKSSREDSRLSSLGRISSASNFSSSTPSPGTDKFLNASPFAVEGGDHHVVVTTRSSMLAPRPLSGHFEEGRRSRPNSSNGSQKSIPEASDHPPPPIPQKSHSKLGARASEDSGMNGGDPRAFKKKPPPPPPPSVEVESVE